jgi:hypothetical protein
MSRFERSCRGNTLLRVPTLRPGRPTAAGVFRYVRSHLRAVGELGSTGPFLTRSR